jgi:hypothetical protein
MKVEVIEPLIRDSKGFCGSDPMCDVKVRIELGYYELDGAFAKDSKLRKSIEKWAKEREKKRIKDIEEL